MVFSIKIFTVIFVILMTVTFSNARGGHGESSGAAAAAAQDEVLPVVEIDPDAKPHPKYGRVIYLRSRDNEETYFLYEKTIVDNSHTMKEFLDGNDNNTVIYPVPNVDAKTLQLICRWARYHYEKEMGEAELDEYDNKFTERDQAELIDILASANFMHFTELKELMCKAVAALIHNKTPEQIRETFGIRDDFNDPEPEEDPMEVDSQPSSSSAKPSRTHSSKNLDKAGSSSSKKLEKGSGSSSSKKLEKGSGSSSSKRMDIDEPSSKSSRRIESSSRGETGSTSGRKERRDKSPKGESSSTSRRDKGPKDGASTSKTLERSSSKGSSRNLERTSSSDSLKSSKSSKSSRGDGASSSRSKADKTSKKK